MEKKKTTEKPKDKVYKYKEKEYSWIKTNFEYRIWAKKFLYEYTKFERDFLKDSKNEFYKELLNSIPSGEINNNEIEKRLKNIKPESVSVLVDFNSDIQTSKEIFLCDVHNIISLLENCLEGFKTPTEIDEELESLALEVLEDFFTKMNKPTNFLSL